MPEVLSVETAEPETPLEAAQREAERWKRRALLAEAAFGQRLAKTVILRHEPTTDIRVRVDRVHSFARIESDLGDIVIADAASLRLACMAAGVELKR